MTLITHYRTMPTKKGEDLLHEETTYKIRGACFDVWKKFGGAFKESIVDAALDEALKNKGLIVESQKRINIYYGNKKVGVYIPDKIINNSVLVELKAKPFIAKGDERQFWRYLQATNYKIGLLINFGTEKLEIKRRVFDAARNLPRSSA